MTCTQPTSSIATSLAAPQRTVSSIGPWTVAAPQPNGDQPAASDGIPSTGADQRERVRRAGRIAALQAELADLAHDRALITQMRDPRGMLTQLDAQEHTCWAHLAELATSHNTDTDTDTDTDTERTSAA